MIPLHAAASSSWLLQRSKAIGSCTRKGMTVTLQELLRRQEHERKLSARRSRKYRASKRGCPVAKANKKTSELKRKERDRVAYLAKRAANKRLNRAKAKLLLQELAAGGNDQLLLDDGTEEVEPGEAVPILPDDVLAGSDDDDDDNESVLTVQAADSSDDESVLDGMNDDGSETESDDDDAEDDDDGEDGEDENDFVVEVDGGSFPDGDEEDGDDDNVNADIALALLDAPNGNSGDGDKNGEGGQHDGSIDLESQRRSTAPPHAAPLYGDERHEAPADGDLESGGVGRTLQDNEVEVVAEVEGGSGRAAGSVDVSLAREQRRASSPDTAPTAGESATSSDDLEDAPESFTLWNGGCCRTCANPFDTDVAIQHTEYTSMRDQHRLPVSCLSCGHVECYSCVLEKFADMWDRNGSVDITHLPCAVCGFEYGHFVDKEPVATNPEQFGLPATCRSRRAAAAPKILLVCQPLILAMIKLQELNEVIKILYELLTGKPLTAGSDGGIYYPKAAALEGSPDSESCNGGEEPRSFFTLWTEEECHACIEPFDADLAVRDAEYTSMRDQHRLPVSCLCCGQVECYSCVFTRLAGIYDLTQSTARTHLPCAFCKVKYGHLMDNEPVRTSPEQFGLPGPGRSSRACRPTKLLVCQALVDAKLKLRELNGVIKILYELLTGEPLTEGPDGKICYPKGCARPASTTGNSAIASTNGSGAVPSGTLAGAHPISSAAGDAVQNHARPKRQYGSSVQQRADRAASRRVKPRR
jgi:hypothetical protein